MAREDQIIIEVEVNASESAERLAVIRAEIDKLTAENKKMRAEQKEANKVLAEGGKLTKEQAEAFATNAENMANNAAKLKELQAAEKMETAQIQISTQNERKFGDSLREMGAQLTQLKNEYRGLTAAQRESAEGQDMLKQIQKLDQTMKDADATMGDWQRNVGHYQNALLGLNGNVKMVADLFAGGFKNGIAAAGTALKQFGKMLLTTPVGWIAAAVAAAVKIFNELRETFKRNDEAGTALGVAMAKLQPIITAVRTVFDGLATVVVKVVGGLTTAATAVLNLIPSFRQASEAAQELVTAQDNLEQTERDYTVESAERQRKIAELKKQERADENLTFEEREKIFQQIDELERADLEERKRIAAEKLRVLEQTAKQERDTSDETANKIAEARAEMLNAETAYLEGTTRIAARAANARKQEQAAQEAAAREAERRAREAAQRAKQRRKEREREQKEAADKELAEFQKLQDMQVAMIKDAGEQKRAQTKLEYDRQIEEIRKRLESEKNLTVEARNSLNQQIVLLERQKAKELAKIDQEEIDANAAAVKKMEEEAKQRYDKIKNERRGSYEKEQLQLENEFQERINSLFGNATAIAQAEMEQAEMRYNSLLEMDAETKSALYENEEQYKAAVLAAEDEMMQAREKSSAALQAQAQEVGSTMQNVTGALSSLFEAAAGDSEEYEKYKKAMAIVDATISLATTIASATAASTAGDPYTMAIRIATNVAAVTAQFASVIAAIKAAVVPSAGSFAGGGIVGGSSYTGDKMTANVNSREMILTLRQQSKLFDMIQAGAPAFGIDYKRMADAFAEGAARIPSPVLDYAEFTAFTRRVAMEDRKVREL